MSNGTANFETWKNRLAYFADIASYLANCIRNFPVKKTEKGADSAGTGE